MCQRIYFGSFDLELAVKGIYRLLGAIPKYGRHNLKFPEIA